MPQPTFDRSNGWWTIRIRTDLGSRAKINLAKDPRWHNGGDWPPPGRGPKCPPDVLLLARPFQDRDAAARLGVDVAIPRATDLGRFLDAYAASYAISRRPASLRVLRRALTPWRAWCESRGLRSVGRVTRADCREYLEHRARSGLAYNTIRAERGMLCAAFGRAIEDGLIASNPWHLCKVPGRDESPGTPSYTAEEVGKVAAALKGWHRDLWLVGVNCGFRGAALRGLKWRDVHWSVPGRRHGLLECRAALSKGGRAYSVPLVGTLKDVLERRRALGPSGKDDLVFPGLAKGGGICRESFASALMIGCRKAGVEYKGRSWHSMRATFATTCHARGVNPRAIQAWMNHASIRQTDRYSHHSTESDDAEAAKLEKSD